MDTGIEKPFKELGKDVKENMPHIKLPISKVKDPFVEKFRKWALIILSTLIGSLALILIIWRIIRRIF